MNTPTLLLLIGSIFVIWAIGILVYIKMQSRKTDRMIREIKQRMMRK